MHTRIDIPQAPLAQICKYYHIRRSALFGSGLGDHFGPDYGVDMLVEFHPGPVHGLLGLARLELEHSHVVGRRVDVRTPADLARCFRDDVLSQAQTQHEE